MLKIGFCGNFLPYMDISQAFSTEAHLYKSLLDMGHQVTRFQENEITGKSMLETIKENPIDAWLWVRTWNFPDDSWFLDELRKLNIPSVSIHLDAYCHIERGKNLRNDVFWHTDYVFSPESDEIADKYFEEVGANHFYSPPGVFKQECYIAEPNHDRFPADIIFIGSYESYHPEHHWYRKKLIDWLGLTYGDKFKLYPNKDVPCVRGHDLNTLLASAKIVIGDSLSKDFVQPNYFSDRATETLGRSNTLLIHPYIAGMDKFFKPDEHMVYYKFDDFVDLKQKIDYYLEHDDKRKAIGNAGHQLVAAEHTYHQRLQNVIDVVLYGKDNRYKQ